MRICISSLSLDTFGGAERVVISDAQHFAQAGHDVHLIADELDPDVLSSYGLSQSVDTHRIDVHQHRTLPSTLARVHEIRRLLQEIEPDVVVAHYHERTTWLALVTLGMDPIFASHVHGTMLWFEDNTRRTVHSWKGCIRDLVSNVPGHSEFWTVTDTSPIERIRAFGIESLECMALRSCDEIFVNTHQVARELDCLYGVESTVNPPGIDDDPPASPTDEHPPTEPPFVFSLSRLDSRKRIDLLIEAFAEFHERRPEFHLVIGGTGEQEGPLRELADDRGVNDVVTFAGHIDEAELPAYYAGAEIFACPGWMSYGLTPLEAVRSRTKVALSTDAFVKEVIGDQPGVEVLEPEIGAWVDGLDRLVECDERPSPNDLPGVDNHAGTKLSAFER